MNPNLLDLEAAERHWHDLQEEAAHERLVNDALRVRSKPHTDTILSRLLNAIKVDRSQRPNNPRMN